MAKINIVQKGLSDTVQYIEGWLKKEICEFYFEFGGMIPLPSFRSQSKKIGAQNTPRRTVGSRKLSLRSGGSAPNTGFIVHDCVR